MFESPVVPTTTPAPVTPAFAIVPWLYVKFVTSLPFTPLWVEFWMFTWLNEGETVDCSEMASPVWPVSVPPVEFRTAVPSPVTIRLPAPVLFRMMALVPPVALIETKFRFEPPMVVLATLTAAPPTEVIVFVAPLTLTVPPPVATKPAPVPVVMARLFPPGVKLIVWPLFVVWFTAMPLVVVIVTSPLKFVEPPVEFVTVIALPAPVVRLIVPVKPIDGAAVVTVLTLMPVPSAPVLVMLPVNLIEFGAARPALEPPLTP